MPLYEYECTACKHRFERIQKFSDEPVTVCEQCGAPVKRLLSSPAIQFKGTGWYVTDYGKSGAAFQASKHAASDGAKKASSTDVSASTKESSASSSEKSPTK